MEDCKNAWFVGKVDHVNKRRTVTENVCVAFSDETHGETTGEFVADKETYGTNKLWCLLRQIAIPLDEDSDDSALDDRNLGEVARSRATTATAPVGAQGPSGGTKRPQSGGGGKGGKRRAVVAHGGGDDDDDDEGGLGFPVEALD